MNLKNTEINANVMDLFSKISLIKSKYKNQEKEKDSYNVFSILGLDSVEKKHSLFIANLLNPRGDHKMGCFFLDKFCQKCEIENLKNVKVICEKDIKTKTFGKGSIDVYIQNNDKGKNVIIENKIYAKDQNCQLAKYHEYDPDAYLFYLTLDGKDASPESLGNLKDSDYVKISYEDFILEWLEECLLEFQKKESRFYSILFQYSEIVKRITNQTQSAEEKMDLAELIFSQEEYLPLYYHLQGAAKTILRMYEKKLKDILSEIEKEFSVQLKYNDICKKSSLSKQYAGFDFCKDDKNLSFEFEGKDLTKMIVGVKRSMMKDDACVEDLKNVLENTIDGCMFESTDDWKVYSYWRWYNDLKGECCADVLNGTFKKDVSNLVKKYLIV